MKLHKQMSIRRFLGFSFLLAVVTIFQPVKVFSQNLSIQSAIVEPDSTITMPIEISSDVSMISGFQLDLAAIPQNGAPDLTIESLTKGVAITTTPILDTHPAAPLTPPVRIGLSTEIPASGSIIPSFNGPGTIAQIEFSIPATAVAGQSYVLNLSNVILADQNAQEISITPLSGMLTVGATTAIADSILAPSTLTVQEQDSAFLTVTVTGGSIPIPGVELYFEASDPSIIRLSSPTARTGSLGTAAINVTGLAGGSTTLIVSSPGLGQAQIAVTVNGISPIINTSPVLEAATGIPYFYDVNATDPQGQTLTYSFAASPAGMTIDSSSGVISWPSPQRPGGLTQVPVTIEVSDTDGNIATQGYQLFITLDTDGDGHDDRTDCDDDNPNVHPGLTEIPYNGLDDDCSLATPDDDIDDDGYLNANDCDDNNPGINPGAVEILYNLIDDDCDPATLDYVDNDGDGYYTQQATGYTNPVDCDDNNPDVNPGQTEVPNNGFDDDCDPATQDQPLVSVIAAIDYMGNVYAAESQGDGTFSDFHLAGNIGRNTRAVTVADFNNDTHPDILAGKNPGGIFYLFLNNGNGSFTLPAEVLNLGIGIYTSYVSDMAAADVNHDGYMDFIAGTSENVVVVALGDGKDNFTTQQFAFGGSGLGLDIADFDHDGNIDIVQGRTDEGVFVHFGFGDGSFSTGEQISALELNPYGVTAADFNNDGITDLIANTGDSGDAYLYIGLGDGTFTSMGYIDTLDTDTIASYDAYDLNVDGNIDVIATDYAGLSLWFYPGNGDGSFGSRVQINTASTRSYTVGCSTQPLRTSGRPHAIIIPNSQTITSGSAISFSSTSSNDNDDSGFIVTWEWDFGDTQTGSGETVSHTYATEGIYSVRLTVTDDDGLKDTAVAQVIVQAAPPVADSGGPYSIGEDSVQNGIYTVPLDGSNSTDDESIEAWLWHLDFIDEPFDGTSLNTTLWTTNGDVTQDDSLNLTGNFVWGDTYFYSGISVARNEGTALYAMVHPTNTTGNQGASIGFQSIDEEMDSSRFTHRIYFDGGRVWIYELTTGVANPCSYEPGEAYEIKIILKETGAIYYLKKQGDLFWSFLYESDTVEARRMRVGMSVWAGNFEV